jgi:Zn-dependent protease with chaperone function
MPAKAKARRALRPTSDRPPFYPSAARWFTAGFERYPLGTGAALLISWTAVVLALWAAAIGALAALVGFLLVVVFHQTPVGFLFGNTPLPVDALGVFGSVIAGAAIGFGYAYAGSILSNPFQVGESIVIGVVVAAVLGWGLEQLERPLLRLRGYRRPSRDEVRRLAPLVENAADALGLGTIPTFAISDEFAPNASARTTTIVLTKSLLTTLEDGELIAVIAHELAHWKKADAVGLTFVWAAGWPVILLYEFGVWLRGGISQLDWPRVNWPGAGTGEAEHEKARKAMLSAAGALSQRARPFLSAIIAFPAFLLINFVLIPLIATESRRSEYEADAAVKAAGLGIPLASALRKLELFEQGNTGWERRLARTHPPMELRIEALQPAQPDDALYQQAELGSADIAKAQTVLFVLGLLAVALAVIVVIVMFILQRLPAVHI